MQHIKKFKCWSNVFHLVPFVLAIKYDLWLYALVYLGVIITSFTYHFKEEKDFARTDIFLAFVLFFLNISFAIRSYFIEPYFAVALSSGVLSLYFYSRQFKYDYNINHGLWHVFSAGHCFFCIIMYLHFLNLF